MSTALQVAESHQIDDKSLFALVTNGDCKALNDAQKLQYYKARCDAAGLDYRAQPFQFISLNGKLVLYALKACTDQLSAKHGIRCEILSQQTEDGIRVVTVRATAKDGRQTDEIGAVNVKGLQGEALCNAYMKASTKAKRRAILAVCGLGMLDESELDTIPSAQPQPTIKTPTRLSERRSDELVGVVRDGAGDRTPDDHGVKPEVVEPDLVDTLMASIDAVNAKADAACITEAQRKRMFGIAKGAGHSPVVMKEWLQSRGIVSTKDIKVSEYDAICERLADPTPLGA